MGGFARRLPDSSENEKPLQNLDRFFKGLQVYYSCLIRVTLSEIWQNETPQKQRLPGIAGPGRRCSFSGKGSVAEAVVDEDHMDAVCVARIARDQKLAADRVRRLAVEAGAGLGAGGREPSS